MTTVLHVAREPMTGVWAMMNVLRTEQTRRGLKSVLGVMVTASWPHRSSQVAESGPMFIATSPSIPGTLAHFYHEFLANPVPRWVKQLKALGGSGKVIVHFHNAWLSGSFLSAALFEVADRVIVTFHGFPAACLYDQPLRYRAHQHWASALLASPSKLTSVDAASLYDYERLFGLPPDRFTIIPNSAPCARSRSPRLDGVAFRVGHVGALNAHKGWRYTAEAVKTLYTRGHNIRLTIVGTGDDQEAAGTWCRLHSAFAEYLGTVTDAGSVVIPTIDALVLPSASEGMPMVILEAMAAGVVPVATAVGGIPSLIQHMKTGLLIDRNTDSVSNALERLISCPELTETLKRQARECFERHYAPEQICRRYEAVYADE